MIRFLFKIALFLCLVFIVLSFFLPGQNRQAGSNAENAVGMFATMAAVSTFVQDMNGFCDRNPQSCVTGKSFFGLMAEKAQEGAAFAYQWLGQSLLKSAGNAGGYLNQQETDQTSLPNDLPTGAAMPQKTRTQLQTSSQIENLIKNASKQHDPNKAHSSRKSSAGDKKPRHSQRPVH